MEFVYLECVLATGAASTQWRSAAGDVALVNRGSFLSVTFSHGVPQQRPIHGLSEASR